MSDLLLKPDQAREPLQAAFSDEANPVGLDGIEFIEYATAKPQALGHVLEMTGFRPVARHRSREVTLYRQGGLNVVVNAHPADGGIGGEGATLPEVPVISAIALRVRDARAAYRYVLDRGAWEVPTHPEAMELNIPAIHGVGGSRIYFVDRWKEFSIYDVDFVPIPSVDPRPPAVAGIHFFGIVQYIGIGRTYDWVEFYSALFGFEVIPDGPGFMLQLIETELDAAGDDREQLHRIGLGVPDVPAAVQALRALGMEFVETPMAHTDMRAAITKTCQGGVPFHLAHTARAARAAHHA